MPYTDATLRTAVSAALQTAGLELRDTWGGDTPYVVMFGNGSDLTGMAMDGSWARISKRLTLVEAEATEPLSSTAMATDVMKVLSALLEVPEARIDGLSADERRTLGATDAWTASVTFTVPITIP